MGYSSRTGRFGGTIRSYWPDDDANTMYLESGKRMSLAAIIEMCKDKWPNADFNDLLFESKEIQTDCLGYDLYDPMDYTDFIIITNVPKIER
jgi:hypothetical protein